MRTKYFISFFVLITFLSGAFFVPNSFADSKERDEIKKAIGHKKARWSARDTKISKATSAERKKHLGSHVPVLTTQEKILTTTSATVPGQLDWRSYNGNSYVTPVKEQGDCSDCWSFATTAALESNKLISSNTPGVFLDLSEQTLNSCSGAGSCSGGYIDAAANFLRDIGLPLESCNPYTATDGTCSVSCSDWLTNPYKISGWYKVNPTTESIKYALYNYGPVVALMSVYTDFYYYSTGVYEKSWGSFEGYHAVLIVGYDDVEQCFIIKDSWGDDWGEAGYGKIAYGEIAGDTLFGFYTIAYENVIPTDFPTLNSIPRDPNNPNTTGQNTNNNAQLSILTGSVKDESGNAVSDAEIKVGAYKAVTNAVGIYVFSSLPAGSYIATINKEGYSTLSENLTVAPSAAVTKDFVISSTDDKNGENKNKKIADPSGVKDAGWYRIDKRNIMVGHNDAAAFYAKQTNLMAGKSSISAPMAGATQVEATPEIKELARGLRYDPKLIFDYVHNKIDYVPYYGALKSPSLTYLDESGNDFDQAALMVALLIESSKYNSAITKIGNDVQVRFVYGKMPLTVAELANWFGVQPTGTAIRRAVDQGRLLFDDFSDSAGPDTTLNMSRVWVSAMINGNTYVFDPAFKNYTYVNSSFNIATAMGFVQDNIKTAGRTGATIGTDYVQNISDSSIRSLLNTYTTNLANAIRTQKPNSDIKEITGGRDITQTQMTDYQTSLSHPPISSTIWDGIPSGYIAQMTIRTCTSLDSSNYCVSPDITYPINTTDLTGQTIWLEFQNSSNGNTPHLHIDTTDVAGTWQASSVNRYLDIQIVHPYVTKNANGEYVHDPSADQRKGQQTKTCASCNGTSSYYAYAISYNFGGMSDKLIKKQKEKLGKQTAISSTSLASAVESLNLLGLSYSIESERSNRMVAALSNTVFMSHHRILLAAQTDKYYVDSRFWISSVFSKSANDNDEIKFYKTMTLTASAMESGVLQQLTGDDSSSVAPPISAVSLLKKANSDGQKIYAATTSNWPTIKAAGYTFTDPYNNAAYIQAYINLGYTVILPATRVAAGNYYWVGYLAKKYDSTTASFGFMVNQANGGFSTSGTPIDPSKVDQNTPDEYTPPSKGTVNILDGSYNYKHTSLQLGGGKTGLSFTHSYDSSNNSTTGTLGRGGSHNYDVRLKLMTVTNLILGSRQPIEAAALIAGSYACLDLIRDNTTTDNVETWVDGSLISNWITDQILNNTVVVQMGNDTVQYFKKADSTFASPPGNTTTLTNSNGTYTITERFGTQYKFNTDNKISQIVDIDNNTVTFAYNTDKTLASVSNNFGRNLSFAYNSAKVSSVSDNATRTVYYYYDGSNNLNKYKDPEAKEWLYGYNADNRMTTLTTPVVTGFPSGITMATNTYDSFGRVMSETVPIQGTNATATYNYYYSGYRNAVEDPQGHSVAHYFDDKMREIVMEDPMGKKTKQEYDGQNHVVKVTDALNRATTSEYDGNNNLTKTTNALGYWVKNTYDSQFRLTDTTDNDNANHNSHFTYDAKHHLLSARDPLNNTVSATYKPNGLKETTTDANSATTTITYDTYGNIKTTTTGSHPAITYTYDSANKYDIRGIRSALTDQVGSTTSFVYNKLGQLTGKTDPLTKVSSSVYDNAGRLISKTDRKNQTITYVYAANGKLAQINYPTGTPVIYTYNNLNQLTSMQDSLGTTTYNSYDAAGRLTSMTDPHGFTISYTYDELGNVKTVTYPGNKTVTYTYDNLNRLKTVTNWLSQTATYDDYDAAGRLPGFTNFNSTRTTYGYDNASRLTAINNQKTDNSVISSYAFTFDGNGNRTNNVQSEPYAPTLDEGTVAYTYNTQKNRLLSTSAEGSFGYDDEGQLQTGYSASYTFDYEHRLKTIGSTQFNYDGGGKRLEAIRNGVTTRYIYDAGGTLLAEADVNYVITKYYIYGSGLLATVTPTGQTYCYHFNGVGSTIAMTDNTQAVVNQYSYDAFGNIAPNPQETISQPFKYVGQAGVMTEPNGFYYMRARYYDPKVGRFISEDPIGFSGGDVNLMAYVGNNPINFIDLIGTRVWFVGFGLSAFISNTPTSQKGKGVVSEIGIAFDTETLKFSKYGSTGKSDIGKDVVTGLGASLGLTLGFLDGGIKDFFGEATERTASAFVGSITTINTNSGVTGSCINILGPGLAFGYTTMDTYTSEGYYFGSLPQYDSMDSLLNSVSIPNGISNIDMFY